ncbi:MAG: S8/S53 family peptidase [Gemmatimonadetes bacterium]|nr:S8/S53 family peptidase [Gemmatimonadota bacterium]
MKYSTLAAALVLATATSACTDATLPTESNRADDISALAYSAADAPARSYDEGGNWIQMPTAELWAAIAKNGGIAHVGLKSPDRRRGMYKGARLVSTSDQARGQDAVLAIAGVRLERRHDRMPLIRVTVDDAASLEKIRRLPFVDYVEPALLPQEEGFADETTSLMDSGCAYPAWESGTHYSLNGDMVPHRFGLMGIEKAWTRARGRGVVIGVADSGLDHWQSEMISGFSSGSSSNRVLRAASTLAPYYYDAPAYDGPCSHGPRMASVATAPRNGMSTLGVAHEADLIAVRFTDGVVDVDAWEAVVAIDYIGGGHSDLTYRRVLPMAWRSSPSATLNDWIDYYYSRGLLFVGAVGQSFCLNPWRGVAWPARKDNVVAVAGVEDNNELPCRMHRGPETDMAGLMDYPVPGEYTGSIAEIKESSSATAVVASVAALIWERYPTWTRDQVIQRIYESGRHYPSRDERRGYGIINAYRAVGGFESLYLDAPTYAQPESIYTATAYTRGDGPFTYQWSNGATTSSTTYNAGAEGTQTAIWVQVTDHVEGLTRTEYATVTSGQEPAPEPCTDPTAVVC